MALPSLSPLSRCFLKSISISSNTSSSTCPSAAHSSSAPFPQPFFSAPPTPSLHMRHPCESARKKKPLLEYAGADPCQPSPPSSQITIEPSHYDQNECCLPPLTRFDPRSAPSRERALFHLPLILLSFGRVGRHPPPSVRLLQGTHAASIRPCCPPRWGLRKSQGSPCLSVLPLAPCPPPRDYPLFYLFQPSVKRENLLAWSWPRRLTAQGPTTPA